MIILLNSFRKLEVMADVRLWQRVRDVEGEETSLATYTLTSPSAMMMVDL